jgi:hypothetical protein
MRECTDGGDFGASTAVPAKRAEYCCSIDALVWYSTVFD